MSKDIKFSYIYFISDGHGHIKIGKADNVPKRLKELQTGNPYRLYIVLSVLVKSPIVAFKAEKELHEMFDIHRLEGEWFKEEPVLELLNTDVVILETFEFGGLQFNKNISIKI